MGMQQSWVQNDCGDSRRMKTWETHILGMQIQQEDLIKNRLVVQPQGIGMQLRWIVNPLPCRCGDKCTCKQLLYPEDFTFMGPEEGFAQVNWWWEDHRGRRVIIYRDKILN